MPNNLFGSKILILAKYIHIYFLMGNWFETVIVELSYILINRLKDQQMIVSLLLILFFPFTKLYKHGLDDSNLLQNYLLFCYYYFLLIKEKLKIIF